MDGWLAGLEVGREVRKGRERARRREGEGKEGRGGKGRDGKVITGGEGARR